jgi:hypothetical protein
MTVAEVAGNNSLASHFLLKTTKTVDKYAACM